MADECYHKIFVQFNDLSQKEEYEGFMSCPEWQDVVRQASRDHVLDFQLSGYGTDDGKLMYYFDTMRRLARDALMLMSKRFPSVRFEIVYHCGIGWYRGYLSLLRGEVTDHRVISTCNYKSFTNESEYTAFLNELAKTDSTFIINNPEKENSNGFGSLYDLTGNVIGITSPKNADSGADRSYVRVPDASSIDWASGNIRVDLQYETINKSQMKNIVDLSVIDDSVWDQQEE